MSSCSCYPKKSDESPSVLKGLIAKYEQRIEDLTKRRCEVRQRLEVMQMKIPAQLCHNMMNMPTVGDNIVENFIKKLQTPKERYMCKCNPCPTKIPKNFPRNLYEYTYTFPPNVKAPPTTSPGYTLSKPIRQPDPTLTKKICSCELCANMVIQRLKEEREQEALVSPKVSIKKICSCDICKSMIPEKLCSQKQTNSVSNKAPVIQKIVCNCATDVNAKAFKGSYVCECDVCAEAVLQRINSPDLNFEPLSCGCDGSTKPERELDVDIPICQCNSCKAELNKRLGEEVTKDECFCKSDNTPNQICDCSICATSALQESVNECECIVGDGIPICSCNTCKKAREVKSEKPDFGSGCICNCDICAEARTLTEEVNKVPSFGTTCICNCDICNPTSIKPGEPKKPCDGESIAASSNSVCSCTSSTKDTDCDCRQPSDANIGIEQTGDSTPENSSSCSCTRSSECHSSVSTTSSSSSCLAESILTNTLIEGNLTCSCFESASQSSDRESSASSTCVCSIETLSAQSSTQESSPESNSVPCLCLETLHANSAVCTPTKPVSSHSSKGSSLTSSSTQGSSVKSSSTQGSSVKSSTCSCLDTSRIHSAVSTPTKPVSGQSSTQGSSLRSSSCSCLKESQKSSVASTSKQISGESSKATINQNCTCFEGTPSACVKDSIEKRNGRDIISPSSSCNSSKISSHGESINSSSGTEETYESSSSVSESSSSVLETSSADSDSTENNDGQSGNSSVHSGGSCRCIGTTNSKSNT